MPDPAPRPIRPFWVTDNINLQFMFWEWRFMVANIPLASSNHLSWLCSLPAFFLPCTSSLAENETQESLWCRITWLGNNQDMSVLPTLFLCWIHSTLLWQLLRRHLVYSSQNQDTLVFTQIGLCSYVLTPLYVHLY